MQSRRNTRGLSGAVVALILVIAAVIIAIVVVGFVFGLFGAFSSSGGVSQAGAATIQQGSSDQVVITVVLRNTGSPTTITSVTIQGQPYSVTTVSPSNTVTVGTGTYTITLSGSNAATLSSSILPNLKGSSLSIIITFSNGQSVTVSAVVQ